MLKKLVGVALASALAFGAISVQAENLQNEVTGYLSKGKVTMVTAYGEIVGDHFHKGIDLVFHDNIVYTPINGKVEKLETYDGNLSVIVISNKNVKDSIVLANVKNCPLKKGQKVKVGDVIGEAGSNSIHFEYWPFGYGKDIPVDPRPFLSLNGTDFEE